METHPGKSTFLEYTSFCEVIASSISKYTEFITRAQTTRKKLETAILDIVLEQTFPEGDDSPFGASLLEEKRISLQGNLTSLEKIVKNSGEISPLIERLKIGCEHFMGVILDIYLVETEESPPPDYDIYSLRDELFAELKEMYLVMCREMKKDFLPTPKNSFS